MKKKTIFALTMAFIMGALAVTPLFAQSKNDTVPGELPYPYLEPLDLEPLEHQYVPHVRHETYQAGLTRLPADTVNREFLADTTKQIGGTLREAQKEQLNRKTKSMMYHISKVGKNRHNCSMYAPTFVAGYKNAEDKNAYLTKVFSKLEYTGSENPEGELVNAIIDQDVEAFRNTYDKLIVMKDKLIIMESVLSNFKFKKANANANAETESEPEVETEVETQAE